MAWARAALIGAFALGATGLSHSRVGWEEVESWEDASSTRKAYELDKPKVALKPGGAKAPNAVPARGHAPARRGPPGQRAPARTPRAAGSAALVRKGGQQEGKKKQEQQGGERSPFQTTTLLLVGSKLSSAPLLEEGYRPFFQDILHLIWVTEGEMEQLQEEADGRAAVVLNQRAEGEMEQLQEEADGRAAVVLNQRAEDIDLAGSEDSGVDGFPDSGGFTFGQHVGFTASGDPDEEATWVLESSSNLSSNFSNLMEKIPTRVRSVAGPLKRQGLSGFACLKKYHRRYQSACLGEILQHIARKHPDARGIFVSSVDFWFNPMELHRGDPGFRLSEIWELGAGLRGKSGEKIGRRCWTSFADIQSDASWPWGEQQKDEPWNGAMLAYEARGYNRVRPKRKPEVCVGWSDAYYLPIELWEATEAMLPNFTGVEYEAALPTIFNYLATYENGKLNVDERCWGGCCFGVTSNPTMLSEHVCGHRMDLSDPVMSLAWSDTLFNQSSRLLPPTIARTKLRRRYSARQEILPGTDLS